MNQTEGSKVFSKILRGASWLGFYKGLSQVFSWIVTIVIARILVPQDYGLMSMATIITGYAQIFSELGLGAALVQKEVITEQEFSSVFWFGVMFGILLAASCYPISYFTARIFSEPRIIPLTQTVSIIFLLGGLSIVPGNILRREFRFRELGFIEMSSTLTSCIGMLAFALLGAGVWTLIFGSILLGIARLFFLYFCARWRPLCHFSWSEASSFIRFGVSMATARSLFYAWNRSDSFFAGRAWTASMLGFYALANQLAKIPTDKIVTLINQVSFSAFSRLQGKSSEFNQLYLDITKVIAIIVFPLFFGAYLVGDNIVKILFNEKWYPMIFIFRYLCIAQIFMAVNSINNFVHASQGRPHWSVMFNLLCGLLMPVSFFFAVQYGLNAIVVPWITVFIVLCLFWIGLTLRKIGIEIRAYGRNLSTPIFATVAMSLAVAVLRTSPIQNVYASTIGCILLGAGTYAGYLWVFDRKFLNTIATIFRS